MSRPSDRIVGSTIDGRYVIQKVLGEGGMGVVYLARHALIDKLVALKALRSDLSSDKEITTRFLNEAQAASRIGSPHIVDISDFGVLPGGSAYFVMEYLRGESLADRQARLGVFSVRGTIHIGKQVAQALAAAHDAGIVHRDMKPDNVMLIDRGGDPDFVKVLDFGIAKVNSQATRLTRAGSVFGTPQYMSPEQAAGVPVDHRSDIYALGIMLYEMLKGGVPFTGDNVMNILSHHMFHPPPPLRDGSRSDLPPELESIVMKCLAKKASERYISMGELLADLDAFERGLPPMATHELLADRNRFMAPPTSFPSGPRPVTATVRTLPRIAGGRLPWVLGGAATLLVAALAVTLVVVRSQRQKEALAAAAASAAAASSTPSAPTTATPSGPAVRLVVVKVKPETALVTFVGGPLDGSQRAVRNGQVQVEVAEGHPVKLRVAADRFVEQNIAVQASDEGLSVDLRPVSGGAPT
ncbi:MAG: serine/threonine protein kinase, partial [Polyangiaceae bacterium]|nr:serine/threonine protein kinase [Polyangiaceae bacterium]